VVFTISEACNVIISERFRAGSAIAPALNQIESLHMQDMDSALTKAAAEGHLDTVACLLHTQSSASTMLGL